MKSITTIGPTLPAAYASMVMSGNSTPFSCDDATVINLRPLCGSGDDADLILGLNKAVVGDLLIVVAQIIVSFQMVYEEKVLSNYAIAPLQAVGSEGNS